MGALTGREMVVGIKQASDWGTAVACGAGDGLLINEDSIKQTVESLKDESWGIAAIKSSDAGAVNVAGTMGGYLRYDGMDVILALAMGKAGAPVQQDATDAYSNKFEIKSSIDGLFATYAALKQTDKVSEHPGMKIHGFTIAGAMNAPATFRLSCIANGLVLDSETNTAATMANVTYSTSGLRIIPNLNQNFHLLLNDATGAALDSGQSGDQVGILDFELSFERPMEIVPDFLNPTGGEPSQSGHPVASLTIGFPRYDADNFGLFTDWLAATNKKGELYFKGPVISGEHSYSFKVSLPNLRITDADATPTGPGRIPARVTFDVLGAAEAPTGMTCTEPFEIEVVNTRTTAPLAA